jgi:hypothetical protein
MIIEERNRGAESFVKHQTYCTQNNRENLLSLIPRLAKVICNKRCIYESFVLIFDRLIHRQQLCLFFMRM